MVTSLSQDAAGLDYCQIKTNLSRNCDPSFYSLSLLCSSSFISLFQHGWSWRGFPPLPQVPQSLGVKPDSNSVCMCHKHTLALKSIDHHNGRLPLSSPSCKPRSLFVQHTVFWLNFKACSLLQSWNNVFQCDVQMKVMQMHVCTCI